MHFYAKPGQLLNVFDQQENNVNKTAVCLNKGFFPERMTGKDSEVYCRLK
jgi:hypothetical protein